LGVSKTTLPAIAAPAALYLLAVAAGVLLSKPLAWALAAVATVVLFLVVAGYERVQRHLPDLGRLPLVKDHGLYEHIAARAPANGKANPFGSPAPGGSAPPDRGWIDPDELSDYLARVNRTMEQHGFGRGAPRPQAAPVTEVVTPESVEAELIAFVPLAGEMLRGDATQDEVDDWAARVGVGVRARGPRGEEEMFLAEGHGLAPADELRAKVRRLQDHILPRVRAGDWTP
jgi:hypothetical protein